MKKAIKLFLVVFTAFALTLSIISIKEARASEVQQCTGWPYIESISYFHYECECHGQPSQLITCKTYFGCHLTCYPSFCD